MDKPDGPGPAAERAYRSFMPSDARLANALAAADQPQAPPALRQALATSTGTSTTTSPKPGSDLRLENMTLVLKIREPRALGARCRR